MIKMCVRAINHRVSDSHLHVFNNKNVHMNLGINHPLYFDKCPIVLICKIMEIKKKTTKFLILDKNDMQHSCFRPWAHFTLSIFNILTHPPASTADS